MLNYSAQWITVGESSEMQIFIQYPSSVLFPTCLGLQIVIDHSLSLLEPTHGTVQVSALYSSLFRQDRTPNIPVSSLLIGRGFLDYCPIRVGARWDCKAVVVHYHSCRLVPSCHAEDL